MPLDSRVMDAVKEHMAEDIGNPSSLHIEGRTGKKYIQEARDSVERIGELSDSLDEDSSDEGSDYGSAASSLSDNISESDTGPSGRGSAGGRMAYYGEGSE